MPIDILYVPADKNSLRTEINLPFCGKNGDRNTVCQISLFKMTDKDNYQAFFRKLRAFYTAHL